MTDDYTQPTPEQKSLIGRLLRFCMTNKLIVALCVAVLIGAAIYVAPFDWNLGGLPRKPVPTDAIPDIGENQQIVFTNWPGRSPTDVDDQITYPLTTALRGIPEIKTIRSTSMFGFSSIYVIFKEGVDFYWARSRILEKLNSLPSGTLPAGVQPMLGPDATALGQIFWYTLEGRDPNGKPTGGWDMEELRTIQDWTVRDALAFADGVAEVAPVGGFVREYQVDIDPDAMRHYGVTIEDIRRAVASSNLDVGARTIEVNGVEYFIRGIGFIKSSDDITNSVVAVHDNVPVTVRQVAHVTLGPALRRGALDKDGAEAVGGVVVARYGANPLQVIQNVKKKIAEIAPGLPSKTLSDGTVSKVTIVPFYDRTGLIYETLGTLKTALGQEILITFIVVILMVMHLRSSLLIGGMLPLAVGLCFIAMKIFGVDANIVALSGIAIAIGTIVDMGIVVCENILRRLDEAPPNAPRLEVIHRAASEVGGAVLTAVATTVVGFLPVFAMIGAEGKLFRPLAFTKTFALIASILIALTVIPAGAMLLFHRKGNRVHARPWLYVPLGVAGLSAVGYGLYLASLLIVLCGVVLTALAALKIFADRLPPRLHAAGPWAVNIAIVLLVGLLLSRYWMPLGPQPGLLPNALFVAVLIGLLLGFFWLFSRVYTRLLRWCLAHKIIFLSIPMALLILGVLTWLGFSGLFGWIPPAAEKAGLNPNAVRTTTFWVSANKKFPGLGKEFMPPLDEGSFLFMPVTMAHASLGEALDILSKQDMAIRAIPEVESVVGKIGRAETPLDPAPISMIETVVTYKPEYKTDSNGKVVRQWRPNVKSPDDIWNEIAAAGKIPGTTTASKLQPIAARIVMLQSGMRAPMGVKVKGPTLEAIEQTGFEIERLLKQVPGVKADAVVADRIVAKPYLYIVPDRNKLKRYGIPIEKFQHLLEVALGGMPLTYTVEGRMRFPVRVRYARELRDKIDKLERIVFPGAKGEQIPLAELATIEYHPGPQAIKREDTFLTSYVLFDKEGNEAEVNVVERAKKFLDDKVKSGELKLPAGVHYEFAGSYENQVRAAKVLSIVLPLALLAIFLIIYFQFKSVPTTALVFSGIFVAWAGGFLLIWLYGRPWFLDVTIFGVNLREMLQVHTVNLSVAVWVGFLALFGIASDNGVIQSTYLDQTFRQRRPDTVAGVRDATVIAAQRRLRPCLMTTATTILALLPVLSSTGRGSDVMVPMAIPSFGGMLVVLVSIFVVPVLYCWLKEWAVRRGRSTTPPSGN